MVKKIEANNHRSDWLCYTADALDFSHCTDCGAWLVISAVLFRGLLVESWQDEPGEVLNRVLRWVTIYHTFIKMLLLNLRSIHEILRARGRFGPFFLIQRGMVSVSWNLAMASGGQSVNDQTKWDMFRSYVEQPDGRCQLWILENKEELWGICCSILNLIEIHSKIQTVALIMQSVV